MWPLTLRPPSTLTPLAFLPSQPLLMMLLLPLTELTHLLPLLLHLLPLRHRALNPYCRNPHARYVLQPCLIFLLLRFFLRNFTFRQGLLAFLPLLNALVHAMRGVDRCDGRQARRQQLLAAPLLALALFIGNRESPPLRAGRPGTNDRSNRLRSHDGACRPECPPPLSARLLRVPC